MLLPLYTLVTDDQAFAYLLHVREAIAKFANVLSKLGVSDVAFLIQWVNVDGFTVEGALDVAGFEVESGPHDR